jgi:GntR family transcriptional regulator
MEIKFDTTIPIYLQIMDHIKRDIVTGMLNRGERIESVRTLAEKFNVNMNTMQRACSELERQGVISTQRGVGSFVSEDEQVIRTLKDEMSARLTDRFISGMKDLGYEKEEIYEMIRKVLDRE